MSTPEELRQKLVKLNQEILECQQELNVAAGKDLEKFIQEFAKNYPEYKKEQVTIKFDVDTYGVIRNFSYSGPSDMFYKRKTFAESKKSLSYLIESQFKNIEDVCINAISEFARKNNLGYSSCNHVDMGIKLARKIKRMQK